MNFPAAWMRQVKPGTMLDIKPLWNHTERSHRHLSLPCKVLAVEVDARGCQSGVMFTVRSDGGDKMTLDAAWFHEPVNK